ncbi:conjugal transfer protein TraR [Priestia koreensis]|uniref:conjugal transfer protein TraR n=1 Tax=Priestia koreensis TaxID=284581 RepID=UPI001F5680AE|nr:conjugal transfer protein TraR [Priestia koreensis]MCM3003847.1 conjugal transfer protein TraR [Priestia koreensis]UNL83947.1 conjugal transfer protein TraR [Priestia koreensis]
MDGTYFSIKEELEMTRMELQDRLLKYYAEGLDYLPHLVTPQEQYVIQSVKADLQDVERALLKLEYGIFGIDEQTGGRLPIDKLRILPTARTENDLLFF